MSITIQAGTPIQSVVDANPAGSTYVLAAGIHRGHTVTPKDGDTFVGGGGSVMTGAVPVTSWMQQGALWTATVAGPKMGTGYQGQAFMRKGYEACWLPEDLFLDDKPLRRVADAASVVAGAWSYDYATGLVTIADSPMGHQMEMSTTQIAFTGTAKGVILEGLTIQRYACPAQLAAIEATNGSGWTIHRCTVQQNHARGISNAEGLRVENCTIRANGELGIGGAGDHLRVCNCIISGNGWAGYSYYWGSGGIKLALAFDVIISRCLVSDNIGPGIWTDLNVHNVEIEHCRTSGNLVAGINLELTRDAWVHDNVIFDDGYNPDGTVAIYGAGIYVYNSDQAVIERNDVLGCMNGIIGRVEDRGNDPVGNPYLLRSVIVDGNTVYQPGGTAGGIVAAAGYESAFSSQGNRFSGNDFVIPTQSAAFAWNGEILTWEQWKKVWP